MATQQRQPTSRMSVGSNILTRMLMMEKQSKQHRNSSPHPMPDGGKEHSSLKTPVAAVSAVIPFTRNARPKVHAPASAAAVRESQSVPRPPNATSTLQPAERPPSPPKADPVHLSDNSTARPSPMPRSQTQPALSVDVNAPKKSRAGAADDDSGSEICVSPSWSDFGGAKKKKEKKRQDKERKVEEKKLKKEEAKVRAADLKGAKRLSKKPPPAAMETQRMPSGLRRNSIVSYISSHSSSGENTRHSRDEKRLSGSSIDSSRGAARSRSTPGTSTELRPDSSDGHKTAISPMAPQLPVLPSGLGWHSRSASSSGTDKSQSWGSEDAYEKELVTFARQIQQASQTPSAPKDIIVSSVKVDHLGVQQQQQPKRISGAWPINRSHTDPEAVKVSGQLKVVNVDERPSVHRRKSSDDNTAINGLLGHRRGHLSGTGGRPRSRDSARSSRSGRSSLSVDRPRSSERPRSKEGRSEDRSPGRAPLANITGKPQNHHAPATYRGPPLDGGSYVHKQRMHQQQLSLAGWADEQAVRIANELAIPEEDSESEDEETFADAKEAIPPKPRPSEPPVQTVEQPKRQMEPPKPPPAAKLPTNKPPEVMGPAVKKEEPTTAKRTIQDGLVLRDARKTVLTAPSPTSPKARVSSLLGFGRRQKSDQDRQSLSTKAPDSSRKSARVSPPPPVPKKDTPPPVPASTQEKFDTVKAQKAVESKASHKPQRRSETAEIVQSDEPTQTAFQSHSRTRTSSSQLLTEDLPGSRPLPRSTTSPVLPSEAKLPSAMADRSRNESPSKTERKNVTFDRSTNNGSSQLPKLETASVKAPEIVVEGISPEGVVRKTSIKRPRSNPNLQLAAPNPHLPSLDFLPELKHQPLPKRTPNRSNIAPTPAQRPSSAGRPSSSQFPAPSSWGTKPPSGRPALPSFSSSPNLQQGTPLRPESCAGPSTSGEVSVRQAGDLRRRTLTPQGLQRKSTAGPPDIFGPSPTPSESAHMKPVAKLFVICCKCNYWHDLPSHLYEAMCLPQDLTRDPKGQVDGKGKATLETMVKCPWCEHCMSTRCCAGWTTILYLQQRHH